MRRECVYGVARRTRIAGQALRPVDSRGARGLTAPVADVPAPRPGAGGTGPGQEVSAVVVAGTFHGAVYVMRVRSVMRESSHATVA